MTYGVVVGEYIPVTYNFENAGAVTVNVLVVAPVGEYAMVTPRPTF
jgi:copper(I)-binding protein